MLYLQSFMRASDAPRSKPFSLADKTNMSFQPRKLGPKKGLGLRGTKAAATVALTPASTCAQDAASQSFVPFPSSDLDKQEEMIAAPLSRSLLHAENGLKRPLPSESRRKRCQAPLADSPHGAAPRRRSILVSPKPRPAAASPPIIVPSPKRPKKSRRAVADMQFTADVHRSILRSMHAQEEAVMSVDGSVNVFREQDRALVDRLSKSLHDQGCSPVLIEGCAHHALPSVEISKAEVDVSSTEEDVVMHGADAAGRAADAAPLAPLAIDTYPSSPSSRAQAPRSPTPPPSTATPALGSRVYEMPQLVAVLHMRRHERTAKVRPQPPVSRVRAWKPSPLVSAVVITASALGH